MSTIPSPGPDRRARAARPPAAGAAGPHRRPRWPASGRWPDRAAATARPAGPAPAGRRRARPAAGPAGPGRGLGAAGRSGHRGQRRPGRARRSPSTSPTLLRPATGYPLPVTDAAAPATPVRLASRWCCRRPTGRPRRRRATGSTSTADGVTVTAGTAAGLFHGVQTLRQLLPAADRERHAGQRGPWAVPGGTIVDHPAVRLPRRDARRRPALLRRRRGQARTSTSSPCTRSTTCTCTSPTTRAGGSPSTPGRGWPPYGGAHRGRRRPRRATTPRTTTARSSRYAAARHITVVPEIDLPGHTNAALASLRRS